MSLEENGNNLVVKLDLDMHLPLLREPPQIAGEGPYFSTILDPQ